MSQFNDSSVPQSASSITPELNKQAEIIFVLANLGLYKHFLERFLEGLGRVLHLPWWAIHSVLYLVTWTAFVFLIDVPKIYPHTGYFSFGAEQVGEFMFTTFLLFHIRQCRSTGILAAARITDTETRLIWLRRYLAPIYWGWVARWKFWWCGKPRQMTLPTWVATVCVLIAYYSGQFLFYRGHLLWLFHAPRFWEAHFYPYPQLIYVYPTIAKAAMMVAGIGHFRWLSGLMKIVRGKCPCTLNPKLRQQLYFKCCDAAIRSSIFISIATAFWVVGDTLAKGFTFWSYLYSVCLVLIYAAQVIIIRNLRLLPRHDEGEPQNFFRELIFGVCWQFPKSRRFAIVGVVWGLMLWLAPLSQLVALINNL